MASIGQGLLILLAISRTESTEGMDWLRRKIPQLRVFEDADGRMNRSLLDIQGDCLLVSQFTLYGSLKKGNRPSFNRAGEPEAARLQFENFAKALASESGLRVETGRFQEHMYVEFINDGPVTLIIDSESRDF